MDSSISAPVQNLSAQALTSDAVVSALSSAFQQGSPERVAALLAAMDAKTMASSLAALGFDIDPGLAAKGRNAVFAGCRADMKAALDRRVVGFGLSGKARQSQARHAAPQPLTRRPEQQATSRPGASVFKGDLDAARAVHSILQSPQIRVDLLGEAPHTRRDALLMVAGQAMKRGVLGFGFDGIQGKYEVALPLSEVFELHTAAAQAVAVESAKTSLQAWSSGEQVISMSEWVPESVQRLLQGPPSLDAAKAILHTIESGVISKHASELGHHVITSVLSQKGLDANAPTVEAQAASMGFTVQAPDRDRGRYFGTVVAQDHRASLIKTTRTSAIVVPFSELPSGQARPVSGASLRVEFQRGNMSVVQAQRAEQRAVAR